MLGHLRGWHMVKEQREVRTKRAVLDYRSCQLEQAKLYLVNMLRNSFEHILFM